MENQKTSCDLYKSPEIATVLVEYEGAICSSNELLEENEGEW